MATDLERVDLFAGLPREKLEMLQRCAQSRSYPRGAVVVSQGDDAHGMFVVRSGSLRDFLMHENGRELTLSHHGAGDYFGELALLDEAPRSASVMTLEPCELLYIGRSDFLTMLRASPDSMGALLRNLVARIRTLTRNVHAFALEDVFGRIHRLFDTVATPEGEHWVVEPRLTQQEIANLVGASREMVNRIVRDLVAGGYIANERNRIVIRRKLPARW